MISSVPMRFIDDLGRSGAASEKIAGLGAKALAVPIDVSDEAAVNALTPCWAAPCMADCCRQLRGLARHRPASNSAWADMGNTVTVNAVATSWQRLGK